MNYINLEEKNLSENIKLFHCDNLELMRQTPDNYYNLAVCDPPYGLNFGKYERYGYKGKEHLTGRYEMQEWDKGIPTEAYFNELFRVSKNQIIWGSNYFPLPPTQCFVFWYKQNPVPNFSDGELAWTSFKRPAMCLDYRYYGSLEGKTSASKKIHQTQKPIALYEFLFTHFAEPGNKILDTHLGSGNIAIALDKINKMHMKNLSLVGCDNNEIIFGRAVENITEGIQKQYMFIQEENITEGIQTDIFQTE